MQIEVIGEKSSKQEIDAYADRAKKKYNLICLEVQNEQI